MTETLNESLSDNEEHPEQQVATESKGVPPRLDELSPAQNSIELLSLDPAFVSIERLSGWIFTGVVLFFGLVGLAFVAFGFGLLSIVMTSCLLLYLMLGGLLAWATQALPKKAYDRAGWCLTPSGLEIRRGIWWRSQISVPLARVQHTDVHQGPLMRRFGLAKLIVHTAGTSNSAVELNGLNFATAQRLRDALVENRGDIDGV